MNGILTSLNASTLTRKPTNRKMTDSSLPKTKNSVSPNRASVSPEEARKAPIAIRIVAGTRLCRRPARSARSAPGHLIAPTARPARR